MPEVANEVTAGLILTLAEIDQSFEVEVVDTDDFEGYGHEPFTRVVNFGRRRVFGQKPDQACLGAATVGDAAQGPSGTAIGQDRHQRKGAVLVDTVAQMCPVLSGQFQFEKCPPGLIKKLAGENLTVRKSWFAISIKKRLGQSADQARWQSGQTTLTASLLPGR